jgi:leucyl aminopeptidase (aminopeptidase T)
MKKVFSSAEQPNKKAINNIFKVNLGVKKDERVLIFTDGYTRKLQTIGRKLLNTGKIITPHIKLIEYKPTGCHGVEPPMEIWREAFGNSAYTTLNKKKLLSPLIGKKTTEKQNKKIEQIIKTYKNEAVNVVIALSYFSTSHTKFRDYLNRLCDCRYASMPLFDEKMLEGAMRVNWKKMLNRTNDIAKRVTKAEKIEINTSNGTFLVFSKKSREAKLDTGIITTPGAFSNLPAGEVFMAPLEGTALGKLVLEWAPTRKLKKPVILHVEKGVVRRIEGKEKYAEFLREKLAENKENANIAEFGIGTNNRASRPDNILESEKIYGTIHIALGDNSTFGGKVRASFHQDFVFFKPTVTLIYKNGKKKTLFQGGKRYCNVRQVTNLTKGGMP